MKNKKQITIATKAGITQGYLSKIMAGGANPTVSVLNNIADAYGISLQKLLKIISEKKKAAA